MNAVTSSESAHHLCNLHLPRYEEIPKIDLYMDQLISYLEESIAPLYFGAEKTVTPSMVNNYVKQGLLSAAHSKKYTRAHVAYLIVICTLKQVFSIAEIERLIQAQIASFETNVAYNYFCTSLEDALKALFGEEPSQPAGLMSTSDTGDFERDLVHASTAAVAYTLYIKASLLSLKSVPGTN